MNNGGGDLTLPDPRRFAPLVLVQEFGGTSVRAYDFSGKCLCSRWFTEPEAAERELRALQDSLRSADEPALIKTLDRWMMAEPKYREERIPKPRAYEGFKAFLDAMRKRPERDDPDAEA